MFYHNTCDTDYDNNCWCYNIKRKFTTNFTCLSNEMFAFFRRMRNTGRGGIRTTWRRSALVTPGVWKRTRSLSAPPSWSEKTPRYDRKWPSCAKTAAAVRRSCCCTKPNTARCEGRASPRHASVSLIIHTAVTQPGIVGNAAPRGKWTRMTRARVFKRTF